MPAHHLSQVATVFVPVSDQDAALGFYVNKLGFEKRSDFSYSAGAHRWIEVCPPESTYALALVPPSEGHAANGDHTYCALLSSANISVRDPVPAQFHFRDLDGNRFLIVSQG